MISLILKSYCFIIFGLALFPGIVSASTEPVRVGPVTVNLISHELSIQPGQPIELGLHIIPDEHWHVYWENPGDAGLPPKLTWTLPTGFSHSKIKYPAPDRIDAEPLTAYGYHGATLYPVTITPPTNLNIGDSITIFVKAEWLVCKEVCLPGTADLSITLHVTNSRPKKNDLTIQLFEETYSRIPTLLPEKFLTQTTITNRHIFIDIQPDRILEQKVEIQFFALDKTVITYSDLQPMIETGESYRLQISRSPYSVEAPDTLRGLLKFITKSDTSYYNVALPVGQETSANLITTTTNQVNNILYAILFAFLGGLILNLMPCVLPVLSLKVLGLVKQASQGRRRSFLHGLYFTAGVLVSFWLIVGIMFILQAGGAQLGWGFQLQSPTFVMVLATGLFLFALSLFGLFEIGFLVGTAGTLESKKSSGYSSSFISGITATLLATPCTAPFMGAALGYTLTQPPIYSFIIYTFLALGMSAPYLLLAIFPNLLKFVPKPGAWMETLKQGLGFMMTATVIWLGWVLASQAGSTALVILLLILLFVSIAAWIYGRWGIVTAPFKSKILSRTIALVIIISSLVYGHEGINRFQSLPNSESNNRDGIIWQEFSPQYLQELLTQGKPVFIDFTAAWCLSCQVNEQVAFSSKEVQEKFSSLGIVPLKADWTNRSDEITQALAQHGRNSVPLYVLYNPKISAEPLLLPEILTPGIVLEALEILEK